MDKIKAVYPYTTRTDGYNLVCRDWKSMKKAKEIEDEPAIFILFKDSEDHDIEVKLYVDDNMGCDHIEISEPVSIDTKSVEEMCMEIFEDYANDEDERYASIRYHGKFYPATMREPAEYPDAYFYCWNCGELLEVNTEDKYTDRCEVCGALNCCSYDEYAYAGYEAV